MEELVSWVVARVGVPEEILRGEIPWILLSVVAFYLVLHRIDGMLRPEKAVRTRRQPEQEQHLVASSSLLPNVDSGS